MRQIYRKVDSKIATIGVIFPAGARYETGSHPHGIAHMIEHMFFKGTTSRTASEINKQIGFVGGRPNAFTSDEEVVYHISVPYENLDKACEILSDMIHNPTFPEEEFLKEKEVVKEEALQYLQSQNWRQHYFLSERLLNGRMRKPIVGSLEDIESFTIQHVWDYYNEFYARGNMIVGMSSNLDEEEAREMMERHFGKPDGDFTYTPMTWEGQLEGERELEFNWPTLEQTEYEMIFPAQTIDEHEDEAASRMMLTILGGGMDSRLWENVREKHGLCYGIGAYAQAYVDYGSLVISCSTREENIPLLRELIDTEIERLKTELVSEEEVERALNKYRMSTYAKNEGSMSTLRNMMHREFYGLPTMDQFDEEVKNVTPQDIQNYARKVFDYDKLIIIESRRGEMPKGT